MNYFGNRSIMSFIALVSVGAALTGCEVEEIDVPNTRVTVLDNFNPGTTVCNPFGGASSEGSDEGLWAQLYYLNDSQPRYSSVTDYMRYGTRANADLFFGQLDIPTHAWDLGFMTQAGIPLVNPKGEALYEWFALHIESEIRLGRLDRPAKYQFAVLSDDGVIMEINDDQAGFTNLIHNDGIMATDMRCATRTVAMDSEKRLPMKLDYFQGPRYSVALIVMWREIAGDEISDPTLLDDPACGQRGDWLFFDPTQVPSAPTEMWFSMLNRGWKVLNTENYLLPETIRNNPCLSGTD
jgi:hypothetical protein